MSEKGEGEKELRDMQTPETHFLGIINYFYMESNSDLNLNVWCIEDHTNSKQMSVCSWPKMAIKARKLRQGKAVSAAKELHNHLITKRWADEV